ncbi:hypothetical protein ACFUV2_21980 [Streptomyces pilosus]|uniref:hypothetical protein n=1 Tax=Streptomyces pilosus TaxID=28893 RepID=UPI00363BAD18
MAVLPGMAFGALLMCVVAVLPPPGTLAEAYGWLIAAFGLGQALGTAFAGLFAGPWFLPAATAALALVLCVPVCHHLGFRTETARSLHTSPERPS